MYDVSFALAFSIFSSILLTLLFTYMYKTTELKHFKLLALSSFVFVFSYTDTFLQIGLMTTKPMKIIIGSIPVFGSFLFFAGMYEFVKKEIPRYIKYAIVAGFVVMLIVSFKVLNIEQINSMIEFTFGASMMWASISIFYFLKLSHVGKNITGISSFILGLVYIWYGLVNEYKYGNDMWYFLDAALFLLIGIGFLISYYEITKHELYVNETRYKLALEGANDGIWEYDLVSQKSFISDRSMKFIGYNGVAEDERRELWDSLMHPDDKVILDEKFRRYLNRDIDSYNIQYRIKSKSGQFIWISTRGKALFDENGRPIKVSGSHTNITKQKESEEKINYLAYFDEVTGLPNRVYFKKQLDQILKNNSYKNIKKSVLSISFDNFKKVNDSLGHLYGDVFLREAGQRIQFCLSEESIITRFGGDQFFVFIQSFEEKSELEELSLNILETLHNPFLISGYKIYVTASVGITTYPEDGNNTYDLLRNADMSMFSAKESGKNRYKFFNKQMNEEVKKKLHMEKNLNDAITNNELTVYYQLQKDIASDKFISAEALVRWIHPERGFISPAEFIPLAEETGLIIPIGDFVLKSACIMAKELHKKGHDDFHISVNVSSIQLQSYDFIDKVKKILVETGLEAKYVVLEITESILMKSFEPNIEKLQELRELGIKIALDDFGTGYSSFNYLINLPIDIMKIDKSFIDDICWSEKKAFIVDSLISIAKKIGLIVVAEGVENNFQSDILKQQGCDVIQGYLFSKPLPFGQIEELL